MIQAVTTPAQGAEYAGRLAGKPYFESVLGTRLALFGAHPAVGWRFYLPPGTAALCVHGGTAALCGALPSADAREELADFLRFAGADTLLCEQTPPPGWRAAAPLTVWELPRGHALPQPPALAGLTLTKNPPMQPVARLAFADADEQDNFYAEACAAIAHGLGTCRALLDDAGAPVCTVGCYAQSTTESWMSAGVTAPAWRGRGLAGSLIVGLANELAADRTVRFACEPALDGFYRRLGFIQTGIIYKYITNG